MELDFCASVFMVISLVVNSYKMAEIAQLLALLDTQCTEMSTQHI